MEKFLHFWTTYNQYIITSLIFAILVIILYLSLRFFFNPQALGGLENEGSSSGVTADLEKTLNKILENQKLAGSSDSATGAGANDQVVQNLQTELKALKTDLQAKEQKIKQTQEELAKAKEGGASSGNGAVLPEAEKQAYEKKLKDLETRLSEYEIISEDIADLSRYKEENARLQVELSQIKSSSPSSETSSAETSTAAIPSASSVTETPSSVDTGASTSDNPALNNSPQSSPQESTASAAIDDEIMRQFAEAVSEQKSAGTPQQGKPGEVDSELMGKFEEFVKKN